MPSTGTTGDVRAATDCETSLDRGKELTPARQQDGSPLDPRCLRRYRSFRSSQENGDSLRSLGKRLCLW